MTLDDLEMCIKVQKGDRLWLYLNIFEYLQFRLQIHNGTSALSWELSREDSDFWPRSEVVARIRTTARPPPGDIIRRQWPFQPPPPLIDVGLFTCLPSTGPRGFKGLVALRGSHAGSLLCRLLHIQLKTKAGVWSGEAIALGVFRRNEWWNKTTGQMQQFSFYPLGYVIILCSFWHMHNLYLFTERSWNEMRFGNTVSLRRDCSVCVWVKSS